MLKILLKSDSSIFYNVASSILSSVDSSLYKVCPYTTELPPEEDGVTFLACGNALKDMWASSLVLPKNRTLSSLSGTPYEYGKSVLFVTYDPLVTEMDTSTVSKLQWSLRLALRYCESGSTAPKLGDYTYVNDFSEVVSYIETKYKETGKKVAVSCDLETIGLDEYNPTAYIVSISFTVAPGMAHVVHFSSKEESLGYNLTGNALWRQINHILNTDMAILRGANFKFDRRWLRYKWGMKNENYKMDTTIVGSLLNENRSNSLNTHAKIHSDIGGYDDVFNKKIDKSRMDLVDKSVLLPYAGGDTDACYQVSEEFKKQLVSDKKLLRFYAELLHPSVIAFENMEREGVLLDTDYYYGEGGLKEEVLNSIKDIEDRAFSLMTNRLKIKHKGMLLLTRAALIKDFMFTPLGLNLKPKMYTAKAKSEDVKYASTAKKHLLMFQDHPKAIEFIKCIKEFSSASKTLSTYIDGFGDHLRVDGRFHPSYILFKGDYGGGIEGGTNTGRTACKDPALQTIPKHTVWSKKLRKGYIAPEGFKVVNWDYSQGELRIAACIANEGNMISAYKHGVDLHLKTGSRLIGIGLEEAQYIKKNHGLSTTVQPSDTLFNLMLKSANLPDTEEGHKTLNLMPKKDLDTIAINIIKVARQNGKAGNFGLLYGMGAAGYKIYARDSYGVDLTDKEAEAARDDFFSLYPRLVEWHNECKNFVKKYKYIRTPLGRIRHLPLATSSNQEAAGTALRQAINAPVQATLSDLGQYSLVKFTEKYGTPHSCRMFLFTHDSLTAYVKEDELDFWVPEVARIMENLPLKEVFGWSPQIKFLSDAEVGDNLANLVEVERTW